MHIFFFFFQTTFCPSQLNAISHHFSLSLIFPFKMLIPYVYDTIVRSSEWFFFWFVVYLMLPSTCPSSWRVKKISKRSLCSLQVDKTNKKKDVLFSAVWMEYANSESTLYFRHRSDVATVFLYNSLVPWADMPCRTSTVPLCRLWVNVIHS